MTAPERSCSFAGRDAGKLGFGRVEGWTSINRDRHLSQAVGLMQDQVHRRSFRGYKMKIMPLEKRRRTMGSIPQVGHRSNSFGVSGYSQKCCAPYSCGTKKMIPLSSGIGGKLTRHTNQMPASKVTAVSGM